jgi:hypothetical protein
MSFVRAFSFLTVVSVVTYTLLSLATSDPPTLPLRNGTHHEIPSFGLGTWLAEKGQVRYISSDIRFALQY